MKLTLIGTGAASGVPVWGCKCTACVAASEQPSLRRAVSCAMLHAGASTFLLDGGAHDLGRRVSMDSLSALLVTHFHVDHVVGLFALRWAEGGEVPALAPPDEIGCADLYKHSGPFKFRHPAAFETIEVAGVNVTPVPLTHSRLTFGYLIEHNGSRLAYLTDTKGFANQTADRVRAFEPHVMVIDCSYPPQDPPPRNHNDLTLALECIERVKPARTLLVHVSHKLDRWLLENPTELPPGVEFGRDSQEIEF